MKEVSTQSQPLIFEESGKHKCLSRIKVDKLTIEHQEWNEEEIKNFLVEEMKCHAPKIGRTFEDNYMFGQDKHGNWSIYAILTESPYYSILRKESVKKQKLPSIGDTFKKMSKQAQAS
jgi:hypothetical protein